MIEQEVKFGPKTGLEAVQNGEHAVVGMASSDDKTKPSRPRDSTNWKINLQICELAEASKIAQQNNVERPN